MKYLISLLLFGLFAINLSAQVDFASLNFWDGEGHYDDDAVAIDKDGNGNIYVLGTAIGPYSSTDIILIKYAPSGAKIWESYWNSPTYEGEVAKALYVDSTGNAYVTGITSFYYSISYYDIVTMKFDPNGNLVWDHVYDAPNDNDYPNDITADQFGNVYVVGDSEEGPSGNRDFITLKYSPTGILLWDRFYNGFTNSSDYARAVSINQAGDVFVTGEARNPAYNYDVTTVKYDASGVQQWVNQFNGTDNSSDYGRDILTGPDGSIYVAGAARSGNSDNLVCIKYDPTTGNQLWNYTLTSATSDGARIIRYSAGDTSIVLGGYQSGFSGNFLTVKIDTAGNYLWQNSYSSGNIFDYFHDVDVDDLGNVYTSGRSSIPSDPYEYDVKLVKYAPNGSQQWVSTYDDGYNDLFGFLSVQDNGEPAIITSSFAIADDRNIHTVRFSTTGNQIWRDIFEGLGFADDKGAKMILDNDYNQIIVGSTNGYPGGEYDDYVVIKMDSLGNELWYSIYKHPIGGEDIAIDAVVDSSNNIYVTGYTSNALTNGTYDITTVKFNPQGDTLWTHTYVGAGGANDLPCAIALDSSGNVFVAGTSVSLSQTDVLLLKYDSNGNLLGDFLYNNAASNRSDDAYDMAIDSSNNIYIVGSTQVGTSSVSFDYLILKFDNNGNLLWEEIHPASVSKDYANKVLISDDGYIYVGGTVWNETSMDLLKYDGLGNQLWLFNEPAADSLADMIIGPSGNLYLTAMQNESFGSDIETFKVSASGQLLWLQDYNHSAGSEDIPYAMTLDPNGNIFIVGTQEHLYNTNYQAVLLEYDATGNFIVQRTYESPANWRDKFTDVESLPSGRILVTGQAYEANTVNVYAITWRFDIMAASFLESDPNPRLFRVNPTNDQITIRNFGATQVDLSNYKLASEGNVINQLSSMTVVQGALIVPPLGEVVLTGLSLDVTGGDLTLYQPAANFNNAADMIDFMQWKNATNPWEGVAVSNSFWAIGTYVTGEPSYEYIGNGTEFGVQYWEGFNSAITAQSNAQCASNCTGSATLTVSGGTPPYSYLWDANAGNQTTATATNLCSGIYTVTVTDAENNQITNVASIGEEFNLTFSPDIVNESCNIGDGSIMIHPTGGAGGYAVSWNIPGTDTLQNNLIAGTYIATVSDANNCIWDTSIVLIQNAAPVINQLTGNDPICFGDCNGTAIVNATGSGPLSYLWNDLPGSTTSQITGLCAGTYVVQVSDTTNCTTMDSVIITDPQALAINQLTSSDLLCASDCDGTATVIASGSGAFSYLWNDPSGATTSQVTGLCAGTYTIQVSNSANCIITDSVTIDSPSAITVSTSVTDDSGSCDGTGTISVSGGTPPFTFLWNDPANQTTSTATGLCQGTYTVVITDANDCEITQTVTVDGTNAVGELSGLNFNIYPNPFSDEVTIEMSEMNVTSVMVIDVTGKIVKEQEFNALKYEMNLEELVSGVYTIRLKTTELVGEIRLVKM